MGNPDQPQQTSPGRKVYLYNDPVPPLHSRGATNLDAAMFCVADEPPEFQNKGHPACGMASPGTIRQLKDAGYALITDRTPDGEDRPLTPRQRAEYASVIQG